MPLLVLEQKCCVSTLNNSGQWFSDSVQINMEAENKFP